VAEAGFKVYTMDLFGHGLSDKPNELDYSRPYDIFSDQIYRFIAKLGLEKVHLVGHSMGGGISIKLTCDHPEVVDKLVLIASAGLTIDRPFNVLLSVLNVPFLGEFIKLFEFRKMTEQSLQRITFNNQFEFSSEYLDYYIMPSTTKGWEAAFFGELRRYHSSDGGGDLSQCLNEIDKQTLIIHGSEDRMIPIEAGREMHKLLKGSSFHEIEGAPHSVMESHAREVNDLLFHFLTPKPTVI
jgi:pimeloyl-ACP methyl ester carboxylesterase